MSGAPFDPQAVSSTSHLVMCNPVQAKRLRGRMQHGAGCSRGSRQQRRSPSLRGWRVIWSSAGQRRQVLQSEQFSWCTVNVHARRTRHDAAVASRGLRNASGAIRHMEFRSVSESGLGTVRGWNINGFYKLHHACTRECGARSEYAASLYLPTLASPQVQPTNCSLINARRCWRC